jgi:hypothetical protein
MNRINVGVEKVDRDYHGEGRVVPEPRNEQPLRLEWRSSK